MTDLTSNRRPLKSRDTAWAKGLARELAHGGVSPDFVSFMSVAFAFVGAAAFAASSQLFGPMRIVALVIAAAGVQLRLLCNLLDGMVAVEHGKAGPYGPIWNELPDRLSDVLLMMGAGLAATPAGFNAGMALGFGCGILAVLTAYVRELGRGLGQAADFSGPMAKPQRMAVLTVAALVATAETTHTRGEVMRLALALIAILTAFTVARRTLRLAKALKHGGGRAP